MKNLSARRGTTVRDRKWQVGGSLLLVGLATIFTGPRPAIAQATPAQPSATPPKSRPVTRSGGLSEVIVTAQKRSERLQDVPISVTVLSGNALTRQGVSGTKDLAAVSPALVTNEGVGFAEYFIRGVGQDQLAAGAQPGVAVYEDGVYDAFLSTSTQDLLGTQRVEVLYGPQGTLYGRNAVGGAVNILSVTPTQNFEGDLKATDGNFDLREFSGYVSGGITDKLAVGIYAAGSWRDSYYSFYPTRPGDQLSQEKNEAIRVKAVWTPTDTLKITSLFEDRSVSGAEAAVLRAVQPNAIGFILGAPLHIAPYSIEESPQTPANEHIQLYKGYVQIVQDLDWASIVSISAFQTADIHLSNDDDATTLFLAGGGTRDPHISDVSEELRLQSNHGPVNWVGGFYYSKDSAGLRPEPFVLPTGNQFDTSHLLNQSIAVFGQATVPIIDALKLTLGGRFESDQAQDVDGSIVVDNTAGMPISTTKFPDLSTTWNAFTPKVTLDYKIGSILPYVTFSQGYKSGQYSVATPAAPGPVKPERLTDIEGGLKATLDNRRLRLNLSGFHYNYKDLQVQALETVQGGVSATYTNAARAEIYGGDATITYLVIPEVTLTDSVAYTHGRYTMFPSYAASVPGIVGDPTTNINATGNPVQRTPTWTNSLSADFSKKFDDESSFFANLVWSYNSGYAWDPSNLYRQPAFNLVNASVGYILPGGKVQVMLWGKNLTNQFYENLVLPTSIGALANDAPPRMFGFTFDYHFGK